MKFNNLNQLWSYILTETLKRLGLDCVVICPGSRSTPLTISFVQQVPSIEAISILDERSAAFFALGRAKASGKPVVLLCTSGTAGANFYPAVIEAKESHVPLLILTTDRPPELRECHSGQTIDQLRLYGNFPNWQVELATPSLDMEMLAYLRQTIIHAWERCQFPEKGCVHLNIPFRDPLSPIFDGTDFTLDVKDFFAGIGNKPLPINHYRLPVYDYNKGIIIAGVAQPENPEKYCQAIANLSKTLNLPILAEGLSPIRNYQDINPYLISTYNSILRNNKLSKILMPEIVVQVGAMPTSKELRSWLNNIQCQKLVIDNTADNLDPLHGKTTHIRTAVENIFIDFDLTINTNKQNMEYLQTWQKIENITRNNIDNYLENIEEIIESKIPWLMSQILPEETPLFINNSMPVRDVEYFWKPNNAKIKPYFNRGANGIDGTISTALGIAHHHKSSVMLTGDLALLHDTNGLLIRNKFIGHLTIILVNNNGGGIFEMLPISKFDPPFEEYFATPQNIDFSQLCATYSVEHQLITSWEQLKEKLRILPETGIRVLEVKTNRKKDAQWRQDTLGKMSIF